MGITTPGYNKRVSLGTREIVRKRTLSSGAGVPRGSTLLCGNCRLTDHGDFATCARWKYTWIYIKVRAHRWRRFYPRQQSVGQSWAYFTVECSFYSKTWLILSFLRIRTSEHVPNPSSGPRGNQLSPAGSSCSFRPLFLRIRFLFALRGPRAAY